MKSMSQSYAKSDMSDDFVESLGAIATLVIYIIFK